MVFWKRLFSGRSKHSTLSSSSLWKPPSGIPPKANSEDFLGRFREIVSDPLNLRISRHLWAGVTNGEDVILHNGVVVPFVGPHSYYGKFSEILIVNRGVHEPLEEYCFQEVLKVLPQQPVMIEMGAYWGHYSMWCQKALPEAKLFLVEPDASNLEAAKYNFQRNGFEAMFIKELVCRNGFEVDRFLIEQCIERVTILHADIQGFEFEMLEGAKETLKAHKADFCFISTHSDDLHYRCLDLLKSHGYEIEVAANFTSETTSHDGFILARSRRTQQVLSQFEFLGREKIISLSCLEKLLSWK